MQYIEKFSAPIFKDEEILKEYVIRKHEPTGLLFASVAGECYGVMLSEHQHNDAKKLNQNLRVLRELTYCV